MALRFKTTGDIEKAGRLKGIGLNVLDTLKRKMSFQNLFQGLKTVRYSDGVVIRAQVVGAVGNYVSAHLLMSKGS